MRKAVRPSIFARLNWFLGRLKPTYKKTFGPLRETFRQFYGVFVSRGGAEKFIVRCKMWFVFESAELGNQFLLGVLEMV